MRALGIVELQRTHQRLEDGVGDAGRIAALELRVVGEADPRERRHLFAAQPWNPARASAELRMPACSGVIFARRDFRNSPISLLPSTSGTVALSGGI